MGTRIDPVPGSNSGVITEYINALQTEINLTSGYRDLNIWALRKLSQFHNNKPFTQINRKEIVSFLIVIKKLIHRTHYING